MFTVTPPCLNMALDREMKLSSPTPAPKAHPIL